MINLLPVLKQLGCWEQKIYNLRAYQTYYSDLTLCFIIWPHLTVLFTTPPTHLPSSSPSTIKKKFRISHNRSEKYLKPSTAILHFNIYYYICIYFFQLFFFSRLYFSWPHYYTGIAEGMDWTKNPIVFGQKTWFEQIRRNQRKNYEVKSFEMSSLRIPLLTKVRDLLYKLPFPSTL